MADENSNTSQYNADFMGYALNAGTQFAMAAGNARQNKINREFAAEQAQINRDFQMEMYQRQLDDSIDWRAHQEEYNSPQAQMQRYREAGINPMYYVTGNGGNQLITTPMQANGSGYGSSVGNPQSHRIEFRPIELAQIQLMGAQAANYQADANLKNANAAHQNFLNSLDSALQGLDFGGKSYAQYKAEVTAAALRYEMQSQSMDFAEKKKVLEHNDFYRQWEKDFKNNELDKLRSELSRAKNEEEVSRVAKEWAKANQWINATTDVLGAILGLAGFFKGTSVLPTVINSSSESYSDNTSRTFHYKVE